MVQLLRALRSGDVCGGVSCVGVRQRYTDKNGKATIESAKVAVCYIYVKGLATKRLPER